MKSYNVILEVSIDAETIEEAEHFANEGLSVVDNAAAIYDIHEVRVVESR